MESEESDNMKYIFCMHYFFNHVLQGFGGGGGTSGGPLFWSVATISQPQYFQQRSLCSYLLLLDRFNHFDADPHIIPFYISIVHNHARGPNGGHTPMLYKILTPQISAGSGGGSCYNSESPVLL